jgi:hypothetical protein
MKIIRILYCMYFGHSKITVHKHNEICCGRCEKPLVEREIKLSLKHFREGCAYCNSFVLTHIDWALLPKKTLMNS